MINAVSHTIRPAEKCILREYGFSFREALINRKNPVIASEAWQSHTMESISWRLLRHLVPRNDGLIRVSLDV